MTNKPGNWRQGIAAFCRWGLAWLSIGLCTQRFFCMGNFGRLVDLEHRRGAFGESGKHSVGGRPLCRE